ncbi:MAG: quinol:cytochrome C oxidoreductase [Planctomycetota bacterium]
MQAHVSIPSKEQVMVRGLAKPATVALVVGLIGIAATAGFAYSGMAGDWSAPSAYHLAPFGTAHMGHSFLVAILWALAICLGGLFFVILQHLTTAGWSVVVRRVGEGVTAGLVPLFLLVLGVAVIPTLMGSSYLYDWANDAFAHDHPLVEGKLAYLNAPFFLVRILFYFAVWIGLSRYYAKHSRAQDDDQDPMHTLKMQKISGVAMVLFALTTTFAIFDLSMSLNPEWFSTMYGVYFFAGAFWSFNAVLALLSIWFEKRGQLKGVVTVEHYHDIGKFMFAFTFFWSYVAFSQFMLYWYADIPEETGWFHYRMWGNWTGLSLTLAAGHFFIPMLGLLSRHVKRHRGVLAFWAVYCLVFQYVDMYWNVMPELHNGVPGQDPAFAPLTWSPMDLTAFIGVAGVVLFAILKRFDGHPAVAIGDPRLPESMRFENF